MDEKQKIINRVKKLLSLAADGAASEGEMENALTFARNLMTKYGIEDTEVVDKMTSTSITEEKAVTKAELATWEQQLIKVIESVCDVQGCTVRYKRVRRLSVKFIGFTADVRVACELYASLVISVKTLARMRVSQGWDYRHRSYANGFVNALCKRTRVLKTQASQEHAIVLRKDLAIQSWIDANMRMVVKAGRRYTGNHDPAAYEHGRKDGKRIALTNRVGGESCKQVRSY